MILQQCEQVLTIGILGVIFTLLAILLSGVLATMKRKNAATNSAAPTLPPIHGMPRAVYACGKHANLVRVGQMAVFNDQKCFFCNMGPKNA